MAVVAYPEDVWEYNADIPLAEARQAVHQATAWVLHQAPSLQFVGLTPLAVREAVALMAAILVDEPAARTNPALVPNMVWQMIRPWR